MPEERLDLNEKINELLSRVQTLGDGQEIIYEEINALKSSSSRITKKDLGLVVIGILASKVVEHWKELIQFGLEKQIGQ